MPEKFVRYYANINPELLIWARETSGLTVEDASRRMRFKNPERLVAAERGDTKLTVPQLREAARVYRRPLAIFFLSHPPSAPEPFHDFRRVPGAEVPQPSPELLLEMRRARRRREVAVELFRDLEVPVPGFDLEASLEEDVDQVAQRTRDWLQIPLSEQRNWRESYTALNAWIAAVEARGTLVFHMRDVPLDEVRAFSISDSRLPVVVLNSKDPPRARVFSLMHETVHLILRMGGLCDPIRAAPRGRGPDERIEYFCNRVAGAILVPADAILSDPLVAGSRRSSDWEEQRIRTIAERFAVSREVILFRLLTFGFATFEFVSRKLAQYRREYAQRERQGEGYPPFHRLVVRDNGRRFTRLVLEALDRERITLADVSDYLGTRIKHLESIAEAVGSGIAER